VKKIIIAFLFFVLAATAFGLVAGTPLLEKRIAAMLEAKGLENVSVSIAHIGLRGAALRGVTIGGATPLVLKDVDVIYSLDDLRRGKLDELALRRVDFEIRQDNGRWIITGLEGWKTGAEGKGNPLLSLPVTPEQISLIPFERLRLEESAMTVTGGQGILSVPLNVTWKKSPVPEAVYETGGMTYKHKKLQIATGAVSLKTALTEGIWHGNWTLADIAMRDAPLPVPVLQGGGTLAVDTTHIGVKGTLKSDDGSWQAGFTMDYSPEKPADTALTITQAAMPWKEGRIAVRNVKIPFAGKEPLKVNLEVAHVSLAELMQSLTGDRVSATGTVSGILPLLVGRDGKIKVLEGSLKAEAPGTIAMPPETIPGDNEQVALVRQVLEDLRYSTLSIATNEDESGNLTVLMTLKGNNPKVYEGRAVKLNVNLTGDVLEFIQKNILFLASPETLLKQEQKDNEEN